RRPSMRRAVILFPSGLTLGNLFFGIFAIIAASRQDFVEAGVYVLLGGACDALDGQVARATNAGTQFGEELDSLVDAITFGLAPGLIMYFAVFNQTSWDWLSVFLFSACAVMRLARFNIEQAGTAKTYFQGLPSPAAGITLASYYWFSQSWLYNYGAIANLKWHVLLRFLMAALAFLMISNIPYPVFPRTGFRSLRAIGATLLLLGSMTLLATRRLEFFFPAALCYVAWGPIRWVFSGLFERRQPTIPYDLSEGEDDEDEEEDAFGPMDSQVHATRQSEREPRPVHVERERARRDRIERPERSAVATRTERSSRAESGHAPRTGGGADRAVAGDRASSADRASRAERSDADRAARREKREKRDKRREREGRAASAPAQDAPDSGVGAITLGGTVTEAPLVTPVLSVVRTEDEVATPGEGVERSASDAGPTRKRKRRRRRGQRDRTAVDSGESNGGADGADSSESEEFDDAPRDEPGESNAFESRPLASRSEVDELRIEPPRAPATPSSPPSEPVTRPPAAPPASTPFTDNNE
ncbi:MAG TPA: CDP-diacylglycerol--serine O-phosphatidyltransferase, partial [Gemmatimonadaceae bacterium]|nr:CDP-diacylglycerol--serine O-phosphatidyltransferase [Gemmatimonadaceae bacterium]